jgi:hypothetical protein
MQNFFIVSLLICHMGFGWVGTGTLIGMAALAATYDAIIK